MVGDAERVGDGVGGNVGDSVGDDVGGIVGGIVGNHVGDGVGAVVGCRVGVGVVGLLVMMAVGEDEGIVSSSGGSRLVSESLLTASLALSLFIRKIAAKDTSSNINVNANPTKFLLRLHRVAGIDSCTPVGELPTPPSRSGTGSVLAAWVICCMIFLVFLLFMMQII